VTVGAELPNQVAALVTGQIDAVVSSSALGFQLAEAGRGRLLFPASDIVKDFMIHTIYASEQTARKNPDAVRRFLRGWFDAVLFMRTHRGAKPSCFSRAQRSTFWWCAADPGSFRILSLGRSRISGAPLRKSYVLHRVREKYKVRASRARLAGPALRPLPRVPATG
jgi:hypothetical protein